MCSSDNGSHCFPRSQLLISTLSNGKEWKEDVLLPLGLFRLMPLMLNTNTCGPSEKPWLARMEGDMPSTLNVLLVLEGETGRLGAFVGILRALKGVAPNAAEGALNQGEGTFI